MIVGKLILKLGIEAENLDALKNFENQAKDAAGTADVAAKQTKKLGDSAEKTNFRFWTLNKGVRDVMGGLQRFRIHVIGATTALTALSIYASKVALDIHRFELNTGISGQKLQEWQQQAAMSGVSADEMASSLSGLQQAMMEIRMGAGDVAPFANLKVGISRDPLKVFEQLKERLNQYPEEFGTAMATRMGIPPNVTAFLREAKSMKQMDKALLLSKEELNRLIDFNRYFNQTWDGIKRMAQKVGSLMAPVAKEVLWASTRMMKAIMDVTAGLTKVWDKLGPFKAVFIGALIAIGAYLFPLTASLIILAAILEDIASYQRGDESVIGDTMTAISKDPLPGIANVSGGGDIDYVAAKAGRNRMVREAGGMTQYDKKEKREVQVTNNFNGKVDAQMVMNAMAKALKVGGLSTTRVIQQGTVPEGRKKP